MCMFKNRCSQSFAIALALLPAVVQTIITLVNGNIGAGVAVAGAFGLVRFRSAPGTAREIGVIFLAMAIGLATGMGYVVLAAVFFVIVAGVLLLLSACFPIRISARWAAAMPAPPMCCVRRGCCRRFSLPLVTLAKGSWR